MTSLKAESFTENNIIDPFKVIRYLENTLPRYNVSTELIVFSLKRLCRRIKGVKVTYRRDSSIKNCVAINGYFDNTKRTGIEIEVCCSSYKKHFNLDRKLYRAMIYDIADTMCHESIHQYQSTIRNELDLWDESGIGDADYYSDPDEMFAFAANIAHNLFRQYGTAALQQLQQLTEVLEFDPYLGDYYTFFYNTPRFNKMLKMIYLNILAIDSGLILHRP